jgi:hypothetical protein
VLVIEPHPFKIEYGINCDLEIQEGGEVLNSAVLLGMRKNCLSSGRSLLYLFRGMVIILSVIILEAYLQSTLYQCKI